MPGSSSMRTSVLGSLFGRWSVVVLFMVDAPDDSNWLALNAEIGAITSAWAQLELNLAVLLSAVLDVELVFAIVLMATVSGFKVRRDIIVNTARVAFLPTKIKEVERIIRRVARAAGRRNAIVHSLLGVHPETPDRLMVMMTSSDLRPALIWYERYALSDLKRVTVQINTLSRDLFDLSARLRRARRQTLHGTPRRGSRPRKVSSRNRPQAPPDM
jgi:hypothetical protein